MKISTQTRYAMRILLELATHADEHGRITAKQIAARQKISEKYLEAIASKLTRARYINSMKGVGGGYQLNRPAEQIRLGEIMELMETTYFEVHCSPNESKNCAMYKHCCMYKFFTELREVIDQKMYGTTLADLCAQQRKLDDDYFEVEQISPNGTDKLAETEVYHYDLPAK